MTRLQIDIRTWLLLNKPQSKSKLCVAASVSLGTLEKIIKGEHVGDTSKVKVARVVGTPIDEACQYPKSA